MNRAFKGIWIPKEVWLNKDLSLIEKVFLVEIDSLDNDQGCVALNNYFAEFFGLSKQRCSDVINKLKAKKYIDVEIKKKGKQTIGRKITIKNNSLYKENILSTPPTENLYTPYGKLVDPLRETCIPPTENLYGSNTFNNTFNNTIRDSGQRPVLLTDKKLKCLGTLFFEEPELSRFFNALSKFAANTVYFEMIENCLTLLADNHPLKMVNIDEAIPYCIKSISNLSAESKNTSILKT